MQRRVSPEPPPGRMAPQRAGVCVRHPGLTHLVAWDPHTQATTCVQPTSGVALKCDDKPFQFDAVLPSDCTQSDVFHTCGKPMVDGVLEGVSGSVLAYGQVRELPAGRLYRRHCQRRRHLQGQPRARVSALVSAYH
jgi:hypothetical protein